MQSLRSQRRTNALTKPATNQNNSQLLLFLCAFLAFLIVSCLISIIKQQSDDRIEKLKAETAAIRATPTVEPAQQKTVAGYPTNSDTRRKFANGMQVMSWENGSELDNVTISAGGYDNTDLLITVDSGLSRFDCYTIAKGDYGKAAASTGFLRCVCRNRNGSEFRENF